MTAHDQNTRLILPRDVYEGTVAYLSDLKVDLDELYDQASDLRLKVMGELNDHVLLNKCPSFAAYTALEIQFKDLSRFIFDAYLNLNKYFRESFEAHDLTVTL